MKPLLRAELIKLRTTRTFAGLAGAAIAISLLITVLVAVLTEPTEDSVLVDVYTTDLSGFFIFILAIVGIAGEWRHRTITSSLLAAPDRLRFLAAKTLAFAAAGLVLSLLISLSVAILGVILLEAQGLPTPALEDLAAQIDRNALVAALLAALGVGIGALIRNQVVAIVAVLVVSFAVEPAILAFAPEVGRFTPFTGLPLGVQDIPSDVLAGEVTLLAPTMAGLAMLAWIAAAFAAAAYQLRARDLD
jgi:ABC-2 type transport system permease protein